MATRNATITVNAKLAAAYKAAPKTRQREALSAMRRALRVAPGGGKTALRLSPEETALFLKINRGLSEKQSRRLNELNEKIEASILTDAEQAELLRLTTRVEKLWVARLRAVIDLAKLRRVPPAEIMRQLEIEPPAYAK
jgi:hypothetical protein